MNPDDYERALLGAVLSGHRGIPDLARQLVSTDFHHPHHGEIWSGILRVFNEGGIPDPLTVRSAMGDAANRHERGPAYLAELLGDAGPSVEHYAKQIKASSVRRRLWDVAQRIAQQSRSDQDPDDLVNDAVAQIDSLRGGHQGKVSTIGQILPGVIDIAQHGRQRGFSTPWPDLDRLIRGLHPGRLYVVGARPGIGKSLMGGNVAAHFALRHGVAAFVASLEMPADEVTQRALAAAARVDLSRLEEGSLDDNQWHRISEAVGVLGAAPILINDDPGQTITDIRSSAQDAARSNTLGLVVVDYLQLIRPTDAKAPREQQVAEISRQLKRLARELSVPVLAMAQVNRAPTGRRDPRPTLNDLRESGAIEADADVVILLHTDPDIPQIVEVDVPKNRSGPKGHAELLIQGHYARLDSITNTGV